MSENCLRRRKMFRFRQSVPQDLLQLQQLSQKVGGRGSLRPRERGVLQDLLRSKLRAEGRRLRRRGRSAVHGMNR